MDLNHIYHPINVLERSISKAKAMIEVYIGYGYENAAEFWKNHYESLKKELEEIKAKYKNV